MSHGQAVARNAAWLIAATTLQKALAFLTFTIVARLVGVEVTGKFFFAVSVTSVFVILTDLGITPVVIREMAADETRGRAVLAKALRAKLFLIPIGIICSLLYILLVGAGTELILAVAFATLVMSADAVSLTWYGALRGRRQLRYEAQGMFTGQLLTAIVSILSAALFHWGLYGLVFGLLCGSLWNVIWSMMQSRRLRLSPQADSHWDFKRLIHAAIPFALAGIFVKVYSYVDTLLLKQFHNALAVGYYAVAYKVTYAFQFLPLAFVAALYPGMSAAYASREREALQKLLTGSLRLMMMVSAPLAGGLSALAPLLVPLIYGRAYSGSIAPLTILPWVLIPIFLDFPIGSLLNATNRAGKKTTAMGIAMVINVAANGLLVPNLGPAGAAWAGVMTFWTLFFLGAWFARHDVPNIRWLASLLVRGLIAAGLLWLGIRLVMMVMPLPAIILFSAALSFTLLFATRLLLLDDVKLLLRWLRKRAEAPALVDEELHDKA